MEDNNFLIKTPETHEECLIGESVFLESFADNVRLVIFGFPKDLQEQSYQNSRKYDTDNKSRYYVVDKQNGQVCGCYRIQRGDVHEKAASDTFDNFAFQRIKQMDKLAWDRAVLNFPKYFEDPL